MLRQARLESTIAISPVLKGIWPQDYKGPVYWMAHKEFNLKAVPTEARMLIAADRHYVIYINGKRAVRQRNFFNGDKRYYGHR